MVKRLASVLMLLCMAGCGLPEAASPSLATAAGTDPFARARLAMVERQMEARDITDQAVLDVMRRTPRHLFVPQEYRDRAYADHALPIGYGQTISQPYIVAFMTQALELEPGDRVLEMAPSAMALSVHEWELHTHDITCRVGRKAPWAGAGAALISSAAAMARVS